MTIQTFIFRSSAVFFTALVYISCYPIPVSHDVIFQLNIFVWYESSHLTDDTCPRCFGKSSSAFGHVVGGVVVCFFCLFNHGADTFAFWQGQRPWPRGIDQQLLMCVLGFDSLHAENTRQQCDFLLVSRRLPCSACSAWIKWYMDAWAGNLGPNRTKCKLIEQLHRKASKEQQYRKSQLFSTVYVRSVCLVRTNVALEWGLYSACTEWNSDGRQLADYEMQMAALNSDTYSVARLVNGMRLWDFIIANDHLHTIDVNTCRIWPVVLAPAFACSSIW